MTDRQLSFKTIEFVTASVFGMSWFLENAMKSEAFKVGQFWLAYKKLMTALNGSILGQWEITVIYF